MELDRTVILSNDSAERPSFLSPRSFVNATPAYNEDFAAIKLLGRHKSPRPFAFTASLDFHGKPLA